VKGYSDEKETVLELLVNPRAGDNFDRKQTEKELLDAITFKNDEIAILHQVSTPSPTQTHASPMNSHSSNAD
jgi:hypothetical protein